MAARVSRVVERDDRARPRYDERYSDVRRHESVGGGSHRQSVSHVYSGATHRIHLSEKIAERLELFEHRLYPRAIDRGARVRKSYARYVNDVIAKAGLHDTFYQTSFYPPAVFSRQVAGYFDNDGPGNEPLAPLLGKNVRPYSISWTQAAGGIVSTPNDVVKWVRDLYTGPILAAAQRAEMHTYVNSDTGAPLSEVSAKNPRAFGLGISRLYKKPIGDFFFYEGETLGYRVAYVYVPSTDTVIVVALNSQPAGSRDHIGPFLSQIYQTLEERGLVALLNH